MLERVVVKNTIFDRLNFSWRLFATGFCFVVFGLGSLLLWMIFFPILRIVVWSRRYRMVFSKMIIRLAVQFFVGLMNGLGVLRFEFVGKSRLNRNGLLILANHPTLIDTLFLIAMIKRAVCIVKADLQRIVFIRGAVNAAGYIFNNHGSELVNDCAKSLENGSNLIVFPEGTRTPPEGSLNFKRGAAHIAIRAKRNITPVLINCQPKTLGKGEKWWQIPPRVVTFQIEVQEDIEIDQFINNTPNESIAARHLTTYLQTYFSERI